MKPILRFGWLLLLVLVVAGCSDEVGGADQGVDLAMAEAGADGARVDAGRDGSADLGTDATPPVPDLGADGPLPVGDLALGDGPAPPKHSHCAAPQALALSGGKASVSGDTSVAADQFPQLTCGSANGPWPGPQLYFRVTLKAKQTYRVTLTPAAGFDAALYAFGASTACNSAAVNAACGKHHSDRPGSGAAGAEQLLITPAKDGDWVLAVDSHAGSAGGKFTLALAPHTPPVHSACAKASKMTLASGKASASGDTSGAVNEYGGSITCGGFQGLVGPQTYYKVALKAKQAYKLSLTAAFAAHLYLFPVNACGSVSSINKACGSSGSSGRVVGPLGPGTSGWLLFTPTTSGDYVVVVDSTSGTLAGKYTLQVQSFSVASNRTCAKPKKLTLSGGKATVQGDTVGIKNQYNVSCGTTHTLSGSQAYYKLALKAGQRYRVALTPAFYGFAYLFRSSDCAGKTKSISAACGSAGKNGDVVGPVAPGKTGELYFTPAKAGDYLVAVDSTGGQAAGIFTLDVSEFSLTAPQTFTAPLSWSFDSACPKLGLTGDWECGAYSGFSPDKQCDAPTKVAPPKAARSGAGMVGTRLAGCHSGKDNAQSPCSNSNPYDDSMLYFAVTLPKTWTKASLSYWSWDDYMLAFDWSEIRVDGKVLAQACKGPRPALVQWTQRKVDLSKYVGQTVTVSFHFMASSVINYSGWYVDDLVISGS